MKRTVPIAIIVVNLLLVLGWIGFEWFADGDELDPAPQKVAEADRDEPNTRGTGPELEVDPAVAAESAATPTEDEASSRDLFDWRRPRDVDSMRVTAPVTPSSQPTDRRTGRTNTEPTTSRPPMPAETPSRSERRPETVTDTASGPRPATQRPERDPSTPTPEKPKDPTEDRIPPELEWIRFLPEEVSSGGEATLTASAADDLAGVRDLVGRLSSPSGNAHLGFALPKNEGTGLWETIIRIPEKAESGRWSISWLRITDKANNNRDHRWQGGSGPPGSSLMVRSPDGDGEPPVLQSVALDRQTMAAGESIQVHVHVTDEPSGVRFVSGTFQSPSGKAWAPFTASGEGSVWTGSVTVPEDGECGEWTLRRITAIDNANNQATWGAGDERIQGIHFYRSFSGSCDADPPVLTRIDLSPRNVANEADSTIEVVALIDDLGSGVANASGFAMAADPSAGSPQRVHFVLQRKGEGPHAPWIGTIQVPRHSMTGRWEIRALRVADEARNQRTYGPADPVMTNAWFIVE